MRDLMKQEARVIPARGHVRVALAEDIRHEPSYLSVTDGFDLSAMNALVGQTRQICTGDDRLQLRGPAADLFEFDFASPVLCPSSRGSADLISRGGRINGIAQWIRLDMDDASHYENQPAEGATSCWGVAMHYSPCAIDTSPRQRIRVGGSHDRHSLLLWLEDGVG